MKETTFHSIAEITPSQKKSPNQEIEIKHVSVEQRIFPEQRSSCQSLLRIATVSQSRWLDEGAADIVSQSSFIASEAGSVSSCFTNRDL